MPNVVLNEYEIKKFTDIINYYIGKKTAGAFSTMLNERVEYTIQVFYDKINPVKDIFPPSNEIILCTTYLTGDGDIHFKILYTLTELDAKKLAGILLCKDTIIELDELSGSSIKELGNIMTGSFFNSVCDGTEFKIDLSIPYFIIGTSDIALKPAKDLLKNKNDLVIADVPLKAQNSELNLRMIIIIEPEDVKKLLTSYEFVSSNIQ